MGCIKEILEGLQAGDVIEEPGAGRVHPQQVALHLQELEPSRFALQGDAFRRMPLEELPAAVRKTGCEAIILSGLLTPGSVLLTQALPGLNERAGVPVFMGGQSSIKVYDALKRARIHVLGTDINTGLARIRELVPDESQGVKGNAKKDAD